MAQLINEAKRFQKLAGIIIENESPAAEEKVKDQIEKTIDSPQTQSILAKMASELSDEEKQKILNFVSSINESESVTEDVDLDKVINKLLPMTEEDTLEEGENDLSTPKNILKQFIFGAPVLAMGLGIAKGMSLGGGAAALAAVGPVFFGAAAAGAILIGLYKVIKAMKSNKEKSTKSGSSGFNVLENSGKYKIQLLIDNKAVMEISANNNPSPEELRDALTALEMKYKNKFDFDKAELIVLDPKGDKVGNLSKEDTFLAQKTTKTGTTYSLGGGHYQL
jgi:hypothetical protein